MTEVNATTPAWPISEVLRNVLYELVKEKAGACVISFRDPDYSPVTGGFHPVEIMIGATGDIQYVTDFAYVGMPPCEELIKELDFNFADGEFVYMGKEYPITAGWEMFRLWELNFCCYHKTGVYEISVEEI